MQNLSEIQYSNKYVGWTQEYTINVYFNVEIYKYILMSYCEHKTVCYPILFTSCFARHDPTPITYAVAYYINSTGKKQDRTRCNATSATVRSQSKCLNNMYSKESFVLEVNSIIPRIHEFIQTLTLITNIRVIRFIRLTRILRT